MPHNLIVGAGAVGCVLASFLQRNGERVSFLVREERLKEYAQPANLTLSDNASGKEYVSARPDIRSALPEQFDRLIIATKNAALDDVIAQLRTLPSHIEIVSTLNGISHLEKLQSAFSNNRVTAATVMFNTQLIGPFHANLNTAPVIHITNGDAAESFGQAGFQLLPWSLAKFNGKLVLNVVNAAGALTGVALNIAMKDPILSRCFVAAIVEAGECLQRAAMPFEMVGATAFEGYQAALKDPNFTGFDILPSSNDQPLELKASMIADLNAGKPTEIDQLNGEIVAVGLQVGFPTPINARLVALIKQRIAGEIGPLSPKELATALGM